jgi:hypothetical protein
MSSCFLSLLVRFGLSSCRPIFTYFGAGNSCYVCMSVEARNALLKKRFHSVAGLLVAALLAVATRSVSQSVSLSSRHSLRILENSC